MSGHAPVRAAAAGKPGSDRERAPEPASTPATACERPPVTALLAAALAALFVWQCWSAASRWSLTYDETIHIPAGYIYWKLGDFSINAEHPPLAKLLATAPLLVTGARTPPLDGMAWYAAFRFCFESNPTRAVVLPARMAVVGLSLLLGALVFVWGRKLLGTAGGLLALGLYVLEPNITAHSSLVTTDVPLALFFFASIAAFAWLAERLTWPRVVFLGLAVGAAVTTKSSALLLAPILLALAAVVAWRGQRLSASRRFPLAGAAPLSTPRSRAAALAVVLAAVAAIAYAAIWAAYGFRFRANGVADDRHTPPAAAIIEKHRRNNVLVARQPYVFLDEHRLLPHPYVAGLIDLARHELRGHQAFLLGRRSVTGWPHYFLVTFFTKTPLPLLILFFTGLALLIRTRLLPGWQLALLLLPVAIYFAAAMVAHLNIGHRHVLPVLPFVVLIAAAALPAALRLAPAWRRRLLPVIGVLVAWSAFEAVRYRPHFLAYFNQLAGGPANGYTVLADSNVDWGQDLYLLKRWVADNRVANLKVAYFGAAWPDVDEGIPCRYVVPPAMLARPSPELVTLADGDVLAISANYLDGLFLKPEGAFDFLRRYRPLARIGYSIFVFRISSEFLDSQPGNGLTRSRRAP